MPVRRSFRLNPQTIAEVAASEEPSELALFMVTGTCPRCGKYQDSGHKAHLERKQCKSRADKLLELKIAGLMDFTFDHARFVVIGSTGSQYIVELKDRNRTCECPDFVYRHRFCKHLWLIFMYLGMFERHQRQDWHQAVSAKLSELTQTARSKEELHLVEETALQQLDRKLERAVAVTAVSEVFVDTPAPKGDASYAKHRESPNIVSYTGDMLQQMSSVIVMPDEQS
ncbi:hypothetical protein WJX82_008461 [Trebouxia sp. C0006]